MSIHRRKANVHQVFHALGDATRRLMMEKLSEGPVSVSQLAKPFAMTLAAVIFRPQRDIPVHKADDGPARGTIAPQPAPFILDEQRKVTK